MFYRLIRIATYAVIIIIPTIILIIIITSLITDSVASSRFEKQLKDSIPENVELLEIESTSGRLQDTGDGLEFLTVALIKSELSIEKLYSYFTEYDFEHAKPDQRLQFRDTDDYHYYQLRLQVAEVDTLPIETEFTGSAQKIYFFKDENIEDFTNIYFIAIYDPAYVF